MSMQSARRSMRGFTLMELMIVVVVIAILAAVALPSYQSQVRKGARAEGKAALLKAASNLERYYTDNNCYPSSASTCGSAATSAAALAAAGINSFSGDSNANAKYDLSVTLTAQAFTLTATPRQADPECGNLTYTNTTAKGSSAGTAATCWGG